MPRKSFITKERAPQPDGEWGNLLEEALTMPGALGTTYSRFYQYSFLNQVLLMSQGVTEPVATYGRWQELGRQVQRGSKAKHILRPITVKLKDELDDDGQPKKITKFKLVNCLFTASETEGDDLPEWEPPEWSADRALGALAIHRVAYASLDGNAQGYSQERNVAINPVARYPHKTLLHEMGHVVLGHTAPGQIEQYQQHRGLYEFQAEGTAYLVANELELPDTMWDRAESRAYVQHWLRGDKPSDKAIREVFSATDAILKAGRDQAPLTTE